jgi:hypothetical protein
MTGLVRRATLLGAVGLLAATAAMAGIPSATTSSQPTPTVIKIVGHGSPPDAAGNIQYTIRDASNNPVPGSTVILNFASCGDVRICSSDVAVGASVNCGANSVTGVTNASGVLVISVAGAGNGVGAPTTTKCVAVTADGVPLSNLGAATADYNGTSGVNSLDGGQFASDLFSGSYRARSDYDGNGLVNSLDGGAWAAILFGLGSTLSCGTLCP